MALKYSNEIVINVPVKRAIELMEDPDNMKHWQPGFISIQHISGEKGKDGMKSELRYKMGKRDIVMTETITKYAFPDQFDAIYKADGVYNEQKNQFIAVDENTTKWVSESYFKFSGFMMRTIGFLMPRSFKKQSCKYQELFKAFAEGESK
ncbi:MAG TPA: SRPBCC family protein [Flavobacteriales bacterium]|jgi:hypothetical protein|nr:SRPBCC family protein [Flavobacteriales bacterium]HAW20500.1 SRPBCC family protein [Flavobacteriales bacterium]